MRFKKSDGIVAAIIAIVGVLLYYYTLPYPFVFDDHIYLVDNPLFRDPGSFSYPFHFKSFVTLSTRLGLDPDLSVNFVLRPVTYFTFYVNHVIDGMNPRGYRVVNTAIHCANAWLVFQILMHLLRATTRGASLPALSSFFIAFCTSLLFLVHPLQIESVTYIVQRFTSLGTLFYLLTVLTYFRSYFSQNKRHATILRMSSLAFLLAGMFSKEDVFTAPFMLVAIDFLVIGTPFKAACKRALPHLLLLPIIPILLILTSWASSDGAVSLSGALNVANSLENPITSYNYLLSQLSVVLYYLRLIILPLDLNLDRDHPLSTSLFQAPVLRSLGLIMGILGGAWFAWRRRQDDVRFSLLFCSLVWFFVTVAPSSSVAPLPDLMAEHRSYLPSIGALLALVCCVDLLRTRFFVDRDVKDAVPVFMGIWIFLLISATVTRNWQWRTNIDLLSDTVAKSPGKYRPLYNLGVAYYEDKNFRQAVDCFTKVIQYEPRYVLAYVGLGKASFMAGMFQKALDASTVGLAYSPGNSEMLFSLALAQWRLGQREKCITTFYQTTRNRPDNKDAHRLLGLVLAEVGAYGNALAELRIAQSLPPFDPSIGPKIIEIEALSRQQGATK